MLNLPIFQDLASLSNQYYEINRTKPILQLLDNGPAIRISFEALQLPKWMISNLFFLLRPIIDFIVFTVYLPVDIYPNPIRNVRQWVEGNLIHIRHTFRIANDRSK